MKKHLFWLLLFCVVLNWYIKSELMLQEKTMLNAQDQKVHPCLPEETHLA